MPADQTVGAKSLSWYSSTVATSSTGMMTRRAALVASWSMCMMAMSGPLPLDTAVGTLG